MDVSEVSTIPEKILETVVDFSNELINKVDGLIRIITLFGSYSKGNETEKSDIDLLIVVDDVYNKWDNVSSTFYFDNLNKILSQEKFRKIHVNTLTLSAFWEMVKNGDPLIISIIRTGKALIDPFGLFGSLKKLLYAGKILPSEEAIEAAKLRVEHNIRGYKVNLIKAFENIYLIFTNSAQYYLMKKGYSYISPEEILEALRKEFGNDELVSWYEDIIKRMKSIGHGESIDINEEDLGKYFKKALEFKKRLGME
ncbi:MAG: hypothetical protein BXU00_01240 [Candidatus Nanoclepta minutus]|uniref:Polymerase beta nucleotidyltransferase domain-containing protein n=1 Tax=Candidatus Nanoclepta minutus TaxID=1940235 RepID=A0A397WN80_9ARCH|nr:MAG: hypothetical protein BXU00_01240 [Candidatus Nanoclepta minutus]